MNILIFNVCFSNNVGDGIIAETTEYIFKKLYPKSSIQTLDLGGRENYGDIGIKAPRKIKLYIDKLLNILPNFISNYIRFFISKLLLKIQVIPKWEEHIKKADFIIIGGGQLISDTDLYFPIRIYLISKQSRKYNVPIHLHAVGVSDPKNWSYLGKKLLKNAIYNNVNNTTIRDNKSKQHYEKEFHQKAKIVFDTGIFSSDIYDLKCKNNDIIGIGVIHPDIVIKHTKDNAKKVIPSVEDYVNLAKYFVNKGNTVEYFSNGSDKDNEILSKVRETISNREKIFFADPPPTASDLVNIISRYKSLVASRLHACIIGSSYNIPIVGLAWDEKLEYFFKMIKNNNMVYEWDKEKIYTYLNNSDRYYLDKSTDQYKITT